MKKLRTRLTVLLVFVLLVSVSAAKAQNTPLQNLPTGSEEQRLQVQATFEKQELRLPSPSLRLSVPKSWQSNADSGELLGATDPESGGRMWAQGAKGQGMTLDAVMANFSANPDFAHVHQVRINNNAFVHYTAPGENVRGFVHLVDGKLVLFKFQPANDLAFTAMAVEIMSTLQAERAEQRMEQPSETLPTEAPQPTPTEAPVTGAPTGGPTTGTPTTAPTTAPTGPDTGTPTTAPTTAPSTPVTDAQDYGPYNSPLIPRHRCAHHHAYARSRTGCLGRGQQLAAAV